MYRGPKAGVYSFVWWLAAPAALACVGLILPQWSAWTALALVGLTTALATIWLWQAGSYCCCRLDRFFPEEIASRRRLASLRTQVEQIEITVRDLRSLRLGPLETVRARWAEVDLDDALRLLRRAMARERALLVSLEAARWIHRVQPLLARLSAQETATGGRILERLQDLRARGREIAARLRLDTEAAECSLGRAVLSLLDQALGELERLDRERGGGSGYSRAWQLSSESDADPESTVQRLKNVVDQLRALRHHAVRR